MQIVIRNYHKINFYAERFSKAALIQVAFTSHHSPTWTLLIPFICRSQPKNLKFARFRHAQSPSLFSLTKVRWPFQLPSFSRTRGRGFRPPPPTKNKHRFGVPENQRRAKSSVLKSITRRSPRTTSPVRDKINNGTAIRFTDSLISRLIHCRSFLLLIKLQRSFALIVVTGYDPSILCSWPSAVPLTLHSCGLELPAIKSFLIEK